MRWKSASQVNPEQAPNTLIIGNIGRWQAEGRTVAAFDAFVYLSLHDLTADILRSYAPQLILSPLISDDFDAIDVAARLVKLGYCGRYRALSNAIPHAKLIIAEIALIAPDLDFDILDVKAG